MRIHSWLAVAVVCIIPLAWTKAEDDDKSSRARNDALAPYEARSRMKFPADLRLDQALAEPTVAQPVFLNFDERGRMWVVQYLQYPFPAGLKILSEDKHLRATYDKVPPPPPRHFPGLDKITIHEDTDGDGKPDKHKTFVSGLNIVTSCVKGRGGLWVLNPPYLLFYPDANNDDTPDGDPVVHLEGFGLEDTHSCVNSLQWGPDGWLYACQGSTVTGKVKRPGTTDAPIHSMGQLIWRYHPEKRRYEIFSEGGGNAFGLEIDAKGRIFSGHNGGDTRGFHYVQGAYLQKGFQKHGSLSNPFAFGYFPAMLHPNVPRFSHNFVIYEEQGLPARYLDRLFAVAPLQGEVVVAERTTRGSTFRTKDVEKVITADDSWFRPVDVKVGPDGAVYVADMYEGQIAHLRHHEGKIDTTNGRIYRLRGPDQKPLAPFDMNKLSTPQLVDALKNQSKWHRRMALRLLGDRKDKAARPVLKKLLESDHGQEALEALWGLNLCGGLDEATALRALRHADPHVRLWAVRLLADDGAVSPAIASTLAAMAPGEKSVLARGQLACSAKRLPAADALPIVRGLLLHEEDIEDPYIPLLVWWAIESKCEKDRDKVLALFEDSTLWKLPLAEKHILGRLMRRFAQAGSRADLAVCAQLLRLAPDAARAKLLVRGFEEAFQGRRVGSLPAELADALSRYASDSIVLGLRRNQPEAVEKALRLLAEDKGDANERLQLIQILGEIQQPRCVPVLQNLLGKTRDDTTRLTILAALQGYDDPKIATQVLGLYPGLAEDARGVAQSLLVSRKSWARQFVESVEAGKIDAATVSADSVRKMTVHRDERLTALIAKHWGSVSGATTAEMTQRIARLEESLRTGKGNPYAGKKLFKDSCAKCHKLFQDGGQIGPDLTTFKRDDINNMLLHIVNPSAEIREGFETVLVATKDGRVATGFVAERDNQVLILKGADGQTVTLRQDQIEEVAPQKKSIMPEGMLDKLAEQQVRDLFAYLRSTQPLPD